MKQEGEKDGTEEGAPGDRARVRRLLVDRLDEAGLVRRKGVSADAHRQWVGGLAEHLAYMSAENLMTLAEVLLDCAAASSPPGVWPAEVLVRHYAHALQAPPLRERRIVSSWLASIEGPVAQAGGYLVELYRFLRRHGRPPLPYDVRVLRDEAEVNNRRGVLIRDRIARDAATAEDRAWLATWAADLRDAERVIEDGRARRAAKGGEVVT